MNNPKHESLLTLRRLDLNKNVILEFTPIDYPAFRSFWAPFYLDSPPLRQAGIYLYVLYPTGSFNYFGKRYTIRFQYKEDNNIRDLREEVEFFVLFEDEIRDVNYLSYLLQPSIIKRYVSFVRVFDNLEDAKAKAFALFHAAHGSERIHMIPYHVFDNYNTVLY